CRYLGAPNGKRSSTTIQRQSGSDLWGQRASCPLIFSGERGQLADEKAPKKGFVWHNEFPGSARVSRVLVLASRQNQLKFDVPTVSKSALARRHGSRSGLATRQNDRCCGAGRIFESP